MHPTIDDCDSRKRPRAWKTHVQPINFMELVAGQPANWTRPRHVQLLQNLRARCGKRHMVCGLLAIALVFGASAQSQNRRLESLIREGESEKAQTSYCNLLSGGAKAS